MEFKFFDTVEVYDFEKYLNDEGLYVLKYDDEIVKLTEDELRHEVFEIRLFANNYDQLLVGRITREDLVIKGAILEVILNSNKKDIKKKERELKRKSKNKRKMVKKSRKKGRK